MKKYYLAVDIGASSGRHILGYMENGKINIEEIYRFTNQTIKIDDQRCWDIEKIFGEVLEGIKKCKEIGKIPSTISIDTWGLDYVLLDDEDKMIGNAVCYRDGRTKDIYNEIFKTISKEELYKRVGIQMAEFNTLCQLVAVKRDNPEYLEKAESLLMIPDYLNFLLTGKMKQEYSNATTTQLLNAETKCWDYDLIKMLGLPEKIFTKVTMPGKKLGGLKKEIVNEVGFDALVVIAPSHDTASAFMAVPTEDKKTLCISSGTWSLMGMETKRTLCSTQGMDCDFTNEGGYKGRVQYLKNCMGLWMIQEIRREIAPELSFSQICELAEKAEIDSVVDAGDNRFLGPESMKEEIKKYCMESNQKVPESVGEIAKVIYRSIAREYDLIAIQIERLQGVKFDTIHIFGGGSNAEYLNKLTAKLSGKDVLAGPGEATAIGNLMCQMIYEKKIKNLKIGRMIVKKSFDVKRYR